MFVITENIMKRPVQYFSTLSHKRHDFWRKKCYWT